MAKRRRVEWQPLRWLLQLDQPVPVRSEAEIEAAVRRNYRWNFWVNLLDGSAFLFSISFASSATILPLFISKLTDSPFPIGLLAVIVQGGWFLPQLFTANLVERLPRKKVVVVNLGLFLERLPYWGIVAAPLLALRSSTLALVVFMLAYAWHTLGAGSVATSWQDMLARIFPVERRGSFFGLTNFIGTGTGMLGAIVSARILATAPFPTNFFIIFLIAAIFIHLSWFFLALTREPAQAVTATRKSHRAFWAELPQTLRQDDNFRHFLIARLCLALGAMGSGFITVSALQRWAIPDSTVGFYTGITLLGQALSGLLLGFLADRWGQKFTLMVSAGAMGLSFALAWLAPTPSWYFAVFLCQGIGIGSAFTAGIMIVLEFCEPERRPTYIGLANTIAGLGGIGAPLLGTFLAQADYGLLFAVSAGLSLLALALLRWWVVEPRLTNRKSTINLTINQL
ncbi:MAG: MFS transporter [Chloroflexota bacterium]|nr:MFS transporter [Chloroflexota bacterium]